jgi:hypothetical protein
MYSMGILDRLERLNNKLGCLDSRLDSASILSATVLRFGLMSVGAC